MASSNEKSYQARRTRTQNSSQLGDRDLDGLTRAHLADGDEPHLVTDPLLVDLDAVEDVVGELGVEVGREARCGGARR